MFKHATRCMNRAVDDRFENVLAVNLRLENVFQLAYQSADLKNWRQLLRMRKGFFVIMQTLYAFNISFEKCFTEFYWAWAHSKKCSQYALEVFSNVF